MVRRIINILNRIIPKRNRIIFNSFPDAGGNPLAVYRYICDKRSDIASKYKLIWITNRDASAARERIRKITGYDAKVYKKTSIRGIIEFIQTKYIITSHNYVTGIFSARDQIHINLWHGMPFKAIGKMLREKGNDGDIQADYGNSTSPVFRDIIAKSFGIDQSKVLLCGQPCNDALFSDRDVLARFGIRKEDYNKVLIWMPTYRKSFRGAIREDGKVDTFGPVEVLQSHLEETERLLEQEGYVLLIKPHPMDIMVKMDLPESNNIRIIRNGDLNEKFVELYELLSECDVLLTDYSSVFIDFMVLNRPIAFVCDDISEYSGSRGFCFDPPREYMPGELITDYKKFYDYIQHIDEYNEKWTQKYKEINSVFNSFCDANSSERVVSELIDV